jgi:hypothetical protein
LEDIGDKARTAISALDAGIDLAATKNVEQSELLLQKAIQEESKGEIFPYYNMSLSRKGKAAWRWLVSCGTMENGKINWI